MALIRRFLADLRATSAMEFAFVLPIMLALVAGTVEFGRWFQAYNGVNRLATRYASVYSDCNDNSPAAQNCNTELAVYWPPIAIQNIAPQLTSGTVSVRMFQVQYSSTGTATVVYSYPSSATMTAAESQAGTTNIYSSGSTLTGVVVTIQYTYAAIFFPKIFQTLAPGANMNVTYTVAQRKN